MPRRPRPASRAPPTAVRNKHANTAEKPVGWPRKKPPVALDDDTTSEDSERSGASSSGRNTDEDSGSDWHGDEALKDEEDADVPRVVQWVDEDQLGTLSESGSESNAGEERPSMNLKMIQKDLSGLPLGALRKAQYTLSRAEVDSESGSDEESNKSSFGKEESSQKNRPEWSLTPNSEIPKRRDKHAPMEISSKKPVTRRRKVVDIKTAQPRDPRFIPLAGEFSERLYQNNYGFLAEARRNELDSLKDNLKRARKMTSSSPRNQRNERESEVKRLELAVKRMESLVNKDKQDKIQVEALRKIGKDEREKRKQGKRDWWMKKAEEKKVVIEARYEALAAEGGKRAVKRVMERKQRKVGQREKRRRPLVRAEGRKRQRIE
ncbi:hypothetical protein APHAL10511_006409 [Amanita phalloides]|nr:hypothetical protein APHAL10511_006409 [Amanita phalloides]